MSLIDWSDPDEMLGLLVEYVADELIEAHGDQDRALFLNVLSRQLSSIAEQSIDSARSIARALREVHDAQAREFASDPVMTHLEACIEELDRIQRGF